MKKLIIFSGSGISAESGISTFRDSGGLWEQYRIEDVATPRAWKNNPAMVQEFYNLRRKQIMECEPNNAHILIAQLESNYEVTVITQNIDDLHERAGSTNVLHLHGNIRQSKSSGPNKEKAYYPIDGWELQMTDLCPDGYVLRPHVVWFEEEVPMYEVAMQQIAEADILIVIGTSLQVYPAAGLINYAINAETRYLIDPNAEELNVPSSFRVIAKNAVEGMTELLQELG
ncbi:MAG: NAD-dependent deacylase [Cryomorphaceae bacterium]|nr:NAD-dependent deacylase [Cryomorphaceae bacterium]